MSASVASAGSMSDKVNQARAVPVRVKKKTLKKLTNSERLEAENAKMEERLRMLRQTIEKEKQQRSTLPQTGYLWKSGQPGAMTTHAREHLSKNKSAGVKMGGDKKIKVKFLTPASNQEGVKEKRSAPQPRVSTPHNTSTSAGDSWAEPQTLPHGAIQPSAQSTPQHSAQYSAQYEAEQAQLAAQQAQFAGQQAQFSAQQAAEGLRSNNAWGEELQRQPSVVGPICGQCELNGAQMNCMECGEKYCSECFGVFHRKGALKSHTSRPLTRQNEINVASRPPNIDAPISENSLWGEYDEDAAAQSFADAVKAWRGEETSTKGNQGEASTKKTADASQTIQQYEPEINFSDNTDLTYFDRMLLKKQKESVIPVADSSESGEITVSQLDFCRDLLAQNLEEDRLSRMENERPESVVEIVEVNSNIGYLEEESVCQVEEIEDGLEDEDIEKQMALAKSLLSTVKIEEYFPFGSSDNISTAGVFLSGENEHSLCVKPDGRQSVYRCEDVSSGIVTSSHEKLTSSVRDSVVMSPRQSVTRVSLDSVSRSRDLARESREKDVTPPRTPVPPPKRAMTPPRVDRSEKSEPTRLSNPRLSRGKFTETPRSPLLKRMPTNPELRRSCTAVTDTSAAPPLNTDTGRPHTADVVILSSQAWKQSFIGFVKAGLPGYTLPSTPPANKMKEEETVLITGGPPTWCPGESRVDNEIFQSRENTISFSLQEEETKYEDTSREQESAEKFPQNVISQDSQSLNKPPPTADIMMKREFSKISPGVSPRGSLRHSPRITPPPVKKSGSFIKKNKDGSQDMLDCNDLDTSTELDYDSELVLADLGKELSATRSIDLGDHITSLRKATPDPVTLLTHEDRMSQLDLESRGMTPEVTALITPRLTTRESLFLDFEDMEQQLMAGENVNDLI